MFALLLLLAFSMEPHHLQAIVSADQARTPGGAYIIRAFAMDKKEFFLESSNSNQVDALLWYPSGKVYARYKRGENKFLGQGHPIYNPPRETLALNFFLPEDIRLKIRQEIKKEASLDAQLQARSLTHKAILTGTDGKDIFFESTQTQILQGSEWVTP
jgi:hypothetical protein